ncbi:restriction endonuclease subunit S [Vibrio parahaemolyticus]|uniref:restriction endonuclease subunit S n=1 Tax=Vibrio parahaemolyticus TaxID=670 RepID=UPI001123F042|nr:restriction endonuclease subunit S [Vibrio parahaemolyticus]MDF4973674.1 restriction endonuclease subunit S [Vibrio parahaemolyticus]MDF5035328.1 restriction endonuclease subunit S [Vibrio parahaemolyticus]MDF5218636.1 restriction endonuclease subunit S [Vibrio parahaemolyticus]MDF5685527.1 restriction endonuclease subunit S [Vibrio parahaemolyticus]QQE16579.1 restriction endonuclease subunit S [Vibrio parahaemolyticus]
MAVENLITEHIDIWTSAVKTRSTSGRGSSKKLELYGIKKLRELILELAVRGKLVPQDSSDEPASVLLERIAQEKAQLVKEKKLKKPKKLPNIIDEEKPFDLPNGWSWIRLNEYGEWGSGSTPKRSNSGYYDGGIPWFKSGELKADYISESEETITELALSETSVRYNNVGDVLVAMYGATIGKTAILSVRATTNQAVCACTPFTGLSNTYLLTLLKAYKARLIGMGAGGAQPNISREKIINTVIALPSTAEQHRIVAKVDELMALCDQLEQQTEASIEAHQVLVTTLLDTLTNSADADELMQNWARISEHFDTLFTTEESIDQLKQTILQLAVMGKLVPQDPSDEPAAELLKRIAEEKAQLVKDKKIKKQKALPPINEDEKPFELPSGWEWERIGTFGVVGTGATPSRSNPKYWDDPKYNWVSSGETSELFVSTTKEKVSELAIQETNVSIYPSGTLIVAMYGQGKTRGQITELTEPAGTNQACAAIQLIEKNESHKDFVKLYFRKSYEELRSNAAGGAQPNLNVGKVQSTVIAVPPLNEQQRINTKVNELLTVCDHLKAHFEAVQSTQLHLTDAIVEQAV